MTEQEDPENEFNNRERAIWPDEPPPFEDPFRYELQDAGEDRPPSEPPPFEPPFVPVAYTPETMEETVRQSGLAWSAGIVFFSSIVFMLFLGWGADLLLGSSPWGLVVGIVLGSIIGFVQFFRITSQIFNSKKTGPSEHPLMPRDDDDE